jgi:hypothetical protein
VCLQDRPTHLGCAVRQVPESCLCEHSPQLLGWEQVHLTQGPGNQGGRLGLTGGGLQGEGTSWCGMAGWARQL